MNFKTLILSIITISFIVFIFFNEKQNKRLEYEDFLLSQYKNIPNHTEDELKNIPKPEHPDLASYQNYFMTIDPSLGIVPLNRLKEAFKYKIAGVCITSVIQYKASHYINATLYTSFFLTSISRKFL